MKNYKWTLWWSWDNSLRIFCYWRIILVLLRHVWDRRICLVAVDFLIRCCTSWSMRRRCWWTGNALVKKSAMLSSDFTHLTTNWFWRTRSRSQWKRKSIDLVRAVLRVSLQRPTAQVLSHQIVVGGCGCPRARAIARIHTAWRATIYAAPYSPSAADAVCRDSHPSNPVCPF